MKVMVLGGGNCQLNLIEYLKSQGDEVILIDYLADCPGSGLCDIHLLISTFDTNAVLKAAKEHSIDAIVTLGTDQPVYTAAIVADELGLPFYLSPEQALSATNKRIMKKMFIENSIPTVDYKLIGRDFTSEDIKGISFPAVIKPVDSQGQRGIYKVNSIEEIRANIDDTLSFSREEKILLEEYYESDEITVNGWLVEGRLTLLSVVDRVTLTSGNHIGICIAHNFPSLHFKKNYLEIESITKKIIDIFGFENGPVYFQYLIGRDRIKVNEIAMRIGGAYEDITLPMISRVDVLELLVNTVKGQLLGVEALHKYDLAKNDLFLSTQMFFLKPGNIAEVSFDDAKLKIYGVKKVYISRSVGDIIGTIENATARAGYFIVEGASFKDMMSNTEKAYDDIKVLDENGVNMVVRYSDYPERYKFVEDWERQ